MFKKKLLVVQCNILLTISEHLCQFISVKREKIDIKVSVMMYESKTGIILITMFVILLGLLHKT